MSWVIKAIPSFHNFYFIDTQTYVVCGNFLELNENQIKISDLESSNAFIFCLIRI